MNTNKHSPLLESAFIHVAPLLLFLSVAGCKPAAPKVLPQDQLTVEYSIDRENILVGDPVELIVTAYFPTNGTLEFPELGRAKDIILLKRDWESVPRDDGLQQTESRYSLTSFRLGEHFISTNTITCLVGGNAFTTNFPQVVLTVDTSIEADASSAIADIKPIHKLPGRIPSWIWITLGIAAIAFLIGIITSRLWKNRETLIASAPRIPSHFIAFQALTALKNKGLLEKDECNPFYTELSLILRTYLEGRFELNAPDETTEEIVEELSRSVELSGTQRNILQDFMRQADEVKFAKGHPDRNTMEAAFSTTYQFVEETKDTTDQSDRTI